MGETGPEQEAGGRDWKIAGGFAVFGVAVLIFGLATTSVPAITAGCVIVLFFGSRAAGARKTKVGSDLVQAESAPPAT